MRFETKLAVLVRTDLAVWQRLNMVAFLVSGIGATNSEVIGEPYVDGSDQRYLPMFRQPVLIFGVTGVELRAAYERAMARQVHLSLFTEQLFTTGHDAANRAVVREQASHDLALAGIALYAGRKVVDAVVKGLVLHP